MLPRRVITCQAACCSLRHRRRPLACWPGRPPPQELHAALAGWRLSSGLQSGPSSAPFSTTRRLCTGAGARKATEKTEAALGNEKESETAAATSCKAEVEAKAEAESPEHMSSADTKSSEKGPPEKDDMSSNEMPTVEDLLKQAVYERAELRVQLKAQWDLNQQRTEQLQKGLDRAEDDRMQLRSELASLTEEFDALAAKYREEVGMRERVRRKGIKGRGAQSRMAYRPSLEYAEKQPSHVCELNHLSLAQLAMLGDHCARRERLLREVMAVDQITWGEAHEVLTSFDKYNEKYYWFETLPYRIAITLAFIGGVSSFVLVFWGPIAEWYGVNIVGESLPEGTESIDSMTFNQVGTWTWTWMEPMLGTASFVILCAQFTRAQASKMNMKTYSDRILEWRAQRLSKKFPQYDASMVQAWAKHLPKVGYDFFPKYEAHFRQKGPASGL